MEDNRQFDYDLYKSIIDNDFDFFVALPSVVKSDDNAAGDRNIYISASNEKVDLQGEVVKSSGIQDSINFLLKAGKLDYDHKSLVDPAYIIGEPLAAEVKDGEFLVKGKLFKGIKVADDVWKLLKATASLGASIGGKILKSSQVYNDALSRNVTQIEKVLLNHIAITPYPINVFTAVKTLPWGSFVKSLSSATDFVAGINMSKAMSTFSASPLRTESLEHGGDAEILESFRNFIEDTAQNKHKCNHVLPDGSFVHGKSGALKHLTYCMGFDANTAKMLAGYMSTRENAIKSRVMTLRLSLVK